MKREVTIKDPRQELCKPLDDPDAEHDGAPADQVSRLVFAPLLFTSAPQRYRLGDRVVVLADNASVPFGARGTVIGMQGHAVDVLFDHHYMVAAVVFLHSFRICRALEIC